MAQATITVTVRVRWWLRLYLYGVTWCCWITGCEPNLDRVGYWIMRGVRIEAK